MFFCAISGEAPLDPVVSTKSGHVYERRLILKYITDNQTDPITGEKLDESDLVSIKANPNTAPPRPPTHSSIPVLLHTLQNEWDALVLEMFALKQQYNSTRQELSYALYAQDAATRVIARIIKERDAAREALANVQATMGVAPTGDSTEDVSMTADEALPKALVDQINATFESLSAIRKKRKTPAGYATLSDIKSFTSQRSIPSLHASSPAGITALAVSRQDPARFLTGGNDKVVQLYDRNTDKVIASLKGHTKKITHVALREHTGHPTLLLSAGADKIAKIWTHDSNADAYMPASTIRVHKGELTGLAVHPISTLVAYASLDKTYSLHDLTTMESVFRSEPGEDAFTALGVHPDGTLLAVGTAGSAIHIYDTRTGMIAASFSGVEEGDGAKPFAVNTVSFSENGYYLLAPGAPTGAVAVWDLRKQKTARTLNVGSSFKVNRVLCDLGAVMYGVAGSEGIRVYSSKWEELLKLDQAGDVSDMAFGLHGKEIWATAGREVKIWGLPE